MKILQLEGDRADLGVAGFTCTGRPVTNCLPGISYNPLHWFTR